MVDALESRWNPAGISGFPRIPAWTKGKPHWGPRRWEEVTPAVAGNSSRGWKNHTGDVKNHAGDDENLPRG